LWVNAGEKGAAFCYNEGKLTNKEIVMFTILLLLLCGVALVGGLAWMLAPLVRSRPAGDGRGDHRRVRRLALLAQAGRSYHRHPHPSH